MGANETRRLDIELPDEAVDHPNQRITRYQFIEPLGKQRRLLPVDTLDKARHHQAPVVEDHRSF